jgi:hypothetical protein
MSSLSLTEKTKLEKLFGMSGGYVLNFSDKTFGAFMADAVEIDIHNEKYQGNGTSKARKLREFWRIEPDYIVGKSVLALVQQVDDPRGMIRTSRTSVPLRWARS